MVTGKLFTFYRCWPCLLLFLWISCKREPLRWDTKWSAPIAYGRAGVRQIIPDTLLSIKNGGEVFLAWKGRLGASGSSDVFVLPDTTVSKFFSSGLFTFTAPPGTSLFGSSEDFSFNTGARLSKIVLKTGKLRYVIKNRVKGNILFTYKLPFATKNGSVLTINRPIPAGNANNPSAISGVLDMTGYAIMMKGKMGDRFNAIASEYDVQLDPNGQAVVIAPSDSVLVSFSFENMVPEYAKGYFGQNMLKLEGNSPVTLFKNLSCEDFQLNDVTMKLTLNNAMGADIACRIKKIAAINSKNGTEVPLQHFLVNNQFQLSRAREVPYQIQSRTFAINAGNSNIADLISGLPTSLSYSIEAALNPLGNISASNDFLVSPRVFDADISIEIPMRLGLKNLAYSTGDANGNLSPENATNFKFSVSENDVAKSNGATLLLKFINDFPMEMRFEPVFFDKDNKPLAFTFLQAPAAKTLFVMRSAVPGPDGRVITPATSDIQCQMTKLDLQQLTKAVKMGYRIYLNSIDAQGKYHLWYDDYKIDFSISARLNYEMELR
jgi:hypothetical protein